MKFGTSMKPASRRNIWRNNYETIYLTGYETIYETAYETILGSTACLEIWLDYEPEYETTMKAL